MNRNGSGVRSPKLRDRQMAIQLMLTWKHTSQAIACSLSPWSRSSRKLEIQKPNNSQVLLSWGIPDHIRQFADGTLPGAHTNANWVDISTNSYGYGGGKYLYTNSISASNRWFHLWHPLQ